MNAWDVKAVDLVALIRLHGIHLVLRGRELVGHCPRHQDASGNLSVSPSRNLWRCWVCGVGGSPVDWIMFVSGIGSTEAIKKLRETNIRPVLRVVGPEQPAPLSEEDRGILQRAATYYHRTGRRVAIRYLEGRGLRHCSTAVDCFQVGYAYGMLLSAAKRAGITAETLQRLGITTDRGAESMLGRVTFPIHGQSGAVGMYGRKLEPTSPWRAHRYLPGGHRGVWNAHGIVGAQPLIVCESIIDALTFWHEGHPNVTAAYGVHGWTQHHWDLLQAKQTRDVLLAFDADQAGDGAATALTMKLEQRGIRVKRIRFPLGMDANAYVRQGGKLEALL